MNEEEKTLNLDDVKFLLEKVHAAQQAGNHVIFRHSNYSTEVIAMEGEISEEKEWDKQFYMHNNAPEEQKATYNECILYLEKLAGEKHDADYIAVENPFNGAIKKRGPNIIMPDYPVAVSDEPNTGRVYETITILELDSLMRDDYTKTENPITQILNYVGSLRTNKVKDKNGYLILTNESTQFYLYAVCNLTPKLRELAFDMDMMDTPDKKGMYKYHKNRNAHIKILSYDKMLNDAENRNNHKY